MNGVKAFAFLEYPGADGYGIFSDYSLGHLFTAVECGIGYGFYVCRNGNFLQAAAAAECTVADGLYRCWNYNGI